MKTDDIPPHFMAQQDFPPENGITPLEWYACLVAAALMAIFGLCLLLGQFE